MKTVVIISGMESRKALHTGVTNEHISSKLQDITQT
jgi:hypothetical protein